jgi:hypothetical protein
VAGPGVSPLMRERTDHRGQLRLDQRLIDRLGRLLNPVINLSGLQYLQYLQYLQQCRLVQGHRVLVSFRETHWRGFR